MSYNEEDAKLHLITPAWQAAGWRGQQLTMEYPITAGQIVLQGDGHRQLAPSYADYLLRYAETLPIAVVEAKKEAKSPGAGLQQAKEYAEKLGVALCLCQQWAWLRAVGLHDQHAAIVGDDGVSQWRRRRL